MKGSSVFNLGNDYNEHALINVLSETFSVTKGQSVTEMITLYDSFDWRLYKKSLLLYQSGSVFFLYNLLDHDVMFYSKINSKTDSKTDTKTDKTPIFAEDFPEGKFKDHINPILKARALLQVNKGAIRSNTYNLIADNQKTVLRLIFESFQSDPAENGATICTNIYLKPIKGYPKHTKRVQQQFEAMGLRAGLENLYLKALNANKRQPGEYATRPNLILESQLRSDEAAKMILRFLVTVIRQNEAGLKQDIDREFVHDFRVSVRRTRSALHQIKSVFPAEVTSQYKRDFSFIGKFSNDLRDLDVYLAAENQYKAMLPDALQADIEPLFDYLRQKRAVALQETIEGLNSKKYAKILQDWEKFLRQAPVNLPTAYNANLPVIELACKRIYKKYQRVLKKGYKLLEKPDDDKMHPLRIQCKELRYLLEFFASLFPPKKIGYLVKQLRWLQDNLGEFNDLRVQEAYLLDVAQELAQAKTQSNQISLAIGCLIGTLHIKREVVRADFTPKFTDFASAANEQRFQELFLNRKDVEIK